MASNGGSQWTQTDVDFLIGGLRDGQSINSMAKELGRSPRALRFKLRKLPDMNIESEDDDQEVSSHLPPYINALIAFGSFGLTTAGMIIYVKLLISSLQSM